MAIPPRLPEDATKSYGGCSCSCHKFPRGTVLHVMACCWPGKRSLFDYVKQVNDDHNKEAELRLGD